MFKKTMILFAVITAVMVLCLSACSSGWKESYEGFLDDLVGKVDMEQQTREIDAEEVIRDKLSDYSEGQTIWFQFDDFDGDGTSEAFAFCGKAGTEYLEGVLWYVNEIYAAELKESGKWKIKFKNVKIGNKKQSFTGTFCCWCTTDADTN
ncbi:MAG: hypothetical protein IIX33_01310, partial [Oscillospiraceae bacterium]|nr:hypothetical protein [Oscillospiraceae bacterium]